MNLFGDRTIMHPETNEEVNVHKFAQVRFSVRDNVLLKYEETRKN